ncbi:uncharacterized protein LOC111084914 isoform X2 [Limulus polyphemus]|uniref:Uncharacterized protein LOC111084914 isoform X2 n=1 Tax=Limulus polyphemus TaxID=6850 RepID=A0ABM1S0P7_LIMPO|nr:uncharacterized protein LOC111084914 isoform X2 [Limulus polyphemus]
MDEQNVLPTDESPSVFGEECSSVADGDQSVQSHFDESVDSGYEASPAGNNCQEIFSFNMDVSTETLHDDMRLCCSFVNDQWSEIEERVETSSNKLGPCGQSDQTCACAYRKEQNCFSSCSCSCHSITIEKTQDQESPSDARPFVPFFIRPRASRRGLETRDVLWSSEVVTLPNYYHFDRSPRFRLYSFFGQPVSILRTTLQSNRLQTNSVQNQRFCALGTGSHSSAGNYTVSVATQTTFEITHNEGYLFNSAGSSDALPDVVQTPSSRLLSNTLVELPFEAWIHETGSILREISAEFEQNWNQGVCEGNGVFRYWLNRIFSWLQRNQRLETVRCWHRYYSSGDRSRLDM